MTPLCSSMSALVLLIACFGICRISSAAAFHVGPSTSFRCRQVSRIQASLDDTVEDDWAPEETTTLPIKGIEKAWRYAKKPLLSIGSKGATASHGNSLRQLLESHTIVKVKVVNTQVFETRSLLGAFEELRELAVASGAPSEIELLQARASERVLLIAMPGTRDRIESGEFPPDPVVWNKSKE